MDPAHASLTVPAPGGLAEAAARASARADARGEAILLSWSRPARLPTPLPLPPGRRAPRALLRSPRGSEVAAVGAAATLTAGGAARLDAVRLQAAALTRDAVRYDEGDGAPGPRFVGGFSFRDDHRAEGAWEGFAGATFLLPEVALVREGGRGWVTVNRLVRGGDDPNTVAREMVRDSERALAEANPVVPVKTGVGNADAAVRPEDRTAWVKAVEAALHGIREGAFEKAVLARRVDLELPAAPSVRGTLAELAARYPECFLYVVEPAPGRRFLGATPELLVRRRGRLVESAAVAGSAARGDTAEADAEHARNLLESPKERAEHDFVVRHVRARLAAVGAAVAEPPGTPGLLRVRNVQHLHTPMEAVLAEARHVLDLGAALHPTPAVAGAPVRKAVAFLRDAEPFDRGWYAGATGWFDADGNGELAVSLRCLLARDRRVSLFAGAGIVEDSDPAREWEETFLKLRPMLEVLGCLP